MALNRTTPGDEETTAKMQKKKAETKEVALNTTPSEEETTAETKEGERLTRSRQ